MPDLTAIVNEQLRFFESEPQRQAFLSFLIPPIQTTQMWAYSSESHTCFILAKNDTQQIVYCSTGFGPSFPWSAQNLNEKDLGADAQWNAYLYEAFMQSTMRKGPLSNNFKLMGPGEREHNI